MIHNHLHIVNINELNTNVTFRLRTNILTLIEGTLRRLSGEVKWDFENENENSINITADASSIKTSLNERDLMFKDAKHLNVLKFNDLKLEAKEFERKAEKLISQAKVTIKDITQKVKLSIIQYPDIDEIKGLLTFNRLDFGLGVASHIYLDDINVRFKIKTV